MRSGALLVLCLSAVCLALDNGLDDKDDVEINPLYYLGPLNPGVCVCVRVCVCLRLCVCVCVRVCT